MGLLSAADAIYDLFGRPRHPSAFNGALLLGAVLLAHRPELPEIVIDEVSGDG
jgi:hypothetical protein